MRADALAVTAQSPVPVSPRREAERSFIGHAKVIGLLTLVSRILGTAREVVFANYLGAGVVASAFTVAFQVPNLFRKLFGEGALSAAFIPLYAQAVKREQNAQAPTQEQCAADFAAASVNLLVLVLLAITIVGELILWACITLGHDLRPDKLLALKFTAIMLPYVLLICTTAFMGSVLQVHHRFAAAAAVPIVLNVCHIAVMAMGAWFLGLSGSGAPDALALQTRLAYWLGVMVLFAGVLQMLMLAPSLRAVGFRVRWVKHLWTPPIKKMLLLSVPVALAAGVLQFSVFLDKGISLLLAQGVDNAGHLVTTFRLLGHQFTYPMEQGAVARLNWAQQLYQFPLGIFAIALATALFPSLSADAANPDRSRFRLSLRTGIEATLFEGLAASIGLIIVRQPVTNLLFLHGRITPHDALLISRSVMVYATGIWAYSLLQIINRAYYALHDTRTPMVMAVVNIVVNTAVEIPLLWLPIDGHGHVLGEAGMAVGTSISFAVQAIIMLAMLNRRIGGMELRRCLSPLAKMLAAAAAMWAACAVVMRLGIYPRGQGPLHWAAQLALLAGTGASVYCGVCMAMGMDVRQYVWPKHSAEG